MSKEIDRRSAMIRLGLGTAGLLAAPGITLGAGKVDLDALADLFRAAPRAEIFDHAVVALRGGADFRTLLGAAFVAGVHDIRPRSVGGKLHAVMMVESAFLLTEHATPRERLLAALWSLDDFKNSQARDLGEGDWILPPRPDVSFTSEAAARKELVAAMESWDAERADRALVGLLPFHDRASLFEILWPYGARCYVDLGHKIIFCSQVERVLGRLGKRWEEPALRSLVNGLLYRDDSITGSELGVFENARRLTAGFPASWRRGGEAPERSEEILRALREASPRQAQQIVVDAFRDGLGPRTVWDGLRLFATEIFHRRPLAAARRHGPVHPVTEVNAFGWAARVTDNEDHRRLMILQAAGWLPLLQRDLTRIFGAPREGKIDLLGVELSGADSELPVFPEIFEDLRADQARARLDARNGEREVFLAHLRDQMVQKAFQSHQYKYVAAIQEESALAHPRWSSRILAPSLTYLPGARDESTEIYERSLHALRGAGLA